MDEMALKKRVGVPRAVWALGLNVLCIVTAELFLKMGAGSGRELAGGVFGVESLRAWQTWVGICFHVSGFGLWAYSLRTVPLSLAFNFLGGAQVLVPVAAWLVLSGERLSAMRWLGIGVVVVGFVMLVPVVAKVEAET